MKRLLMLALAAALVAAMVPSKAAAVPVATSDHTWTTAWFEVAAGWIESLVGGAASRPASSAAQTPVAAAAGNEEDSGPTIDPDA
jgi:hypothetical protein